jgi:DHA3 family macrolide efflux protein-like MFS transporter
MLMLKALRKRPIALLWCGQATSAIGDELYRVALIWLAVSLIGADTGYLSAGQSASLLLLSVIGGRWADHWDHLKTMIGVDCLRGLIILVPVILFHFIPMSFSVLVVVAITVSALSAFFDPAIQATLPRFSENSENLQAAAGLMSTTLRLARVVGPGIVALLTGLIPTIHFFTLDAATFFISALSIFLLRKEPAHAEYRAPAMKRASFRESLVAGFRTLSGSREMQFVTFVKSLGGGIWSLAYGLGVALFVQKIAPGPGNVRAFGWVIASYGIGNLGCALILGNMKRKHSFAILYSGYFWMGIGFLAMGLSSNLRSLIWASAMAGFGGVMNDLPFTDLVQSRYSIHQIPQLFRLRMAGETAGTLFFMLLAPTLFRAIAVEKVLIVCGGVFFLFGAVGFMGFNPSPGMLRKATA